MVSARERRRGRGGRVAHALPARASSVDPSTAAHAFVRRTPPGRSWTDRSFRLSEPARYLQPASLYADPAVTRSLRLRKVKEPRDLPDTSPVS